METNTTETTTTTQLTVPEAINRIRARSFCSADVIEHLDRLYNRGLVNYTDARTIAREFAVDWD